MSQVTTYANTVSITVNSLPKSGTAITDFSLSYIVDPTPDNPFSSAPQILINAPKGITPTNLIESQIAFTFTQALASPIGFVVSGIQANSDSSQPLYRSSKAIPSGNNAIVIMTVPEKLPATTTSKFDYTIAITTTGSSPQTYTIDPDIPVEVQN